MASTKSRRVNPKYKKRYRVGNWPAYERGLRARGDSGGLINSEQGKHPPPRQAATTLIRPAFRERGFCRMTISMSRSRAVSRFIRRSTEKPASL